MAWEYEMNLEPKMDKYCGDLIESTRGARQSGVDTFNVLNGLVGTIALSIKASGGNNHDVAAAFRTFADSYDERTEGQHCTALREATVR